MEVFFEKLIKSHDAPFFTHDIRQCRFYLPGYQRIRSFVIVQASVRAMDVVQQFTMQLNARAPPTSVIRGASKVRFSFLLLSMDGLILNVIDVGISVDVDLT